MAQIQTGTWTNANPAVARNQSIGFQVTEVTTVDVTNGGSFYWNSSMDDGYYLDVDAGTITTSNGFTPYDSGAAFGPIISGFTEATPGVITATLISDFGVAAGDTIRVVAVADDLTGTTLNGTYTVASVTSTTITLNESTASGYATYVSGGFVQRVSDSSGEPVPVENKGIQGITFGTGVVGQASAVMTYVARGDNPVT